MWRNRFVALAIAIACCRLYGAELTLTWPLHHDVKYVGPAVVELRQLQRTRDAESTPELTTPIELASGSRSIDIPSGLWLVTLRADSFWAKSRTIYVRDSSPATVQLDLLPTAVVEGTVDASDGGKDIPPLSARFQANGDLGNEVSGEVTCALKERKFQCRVPAVDSDLRLQAAGFVPRFFWALPLSKRNGAANLGVLRLAAGASIFGTIAAGSRGSDRFPTTAHIDASAMTADNAVLSPASLRRYSAKSSAKGFFHIDGVTPGQYAVSASDGTRRSQAAIVRVLPGVSAELRAPLKLEIPAQIMIHAEPPRDPGGLPWQITIERLAGLSRAEVVTKSYLSPNGDFSSSKLFSGPYTVSLGAHNGGRFRTEDIVVAGVDVRLDMTVPSRAIHGSVLLGDKPLAAQIRFADWLGNFTQIESADDGSFKGALANPDETVWRISISSETPPIRRTLQEYAIGRNQEEVSLILPQTMIMGDVVDESDKSAAHALISVRRMDDAAARTSSRAQCDSNGKFVLYGLETGRYVAVASAFLKQSNPVEFQIKDHLDVPELRLVLHDETKIHGHVMSGFGDVAGAGVYLFSTTFPDSGAIMERTDDAGEFSGTVPPMTQEIDVVLVPPVFACKLVHTRVRPSGTLNLGVDITGGTLLVPIARGALRPFVSHGGALVSAELLASELNGASVGGHLAIPRMEAGAYWLCMLRADEISFARRTQDLSDRCVSGFLAPGGELDLSASR